MTEQILTKEIDANRKNRIILFCILAIIISIGVLGTWLYWQLIGSRHVTTDNAYTAADIALVTGEIVGTVKDIRVIDTQKVKKGDLLVILDETDTKIALEHAEAEHAKAEAQLAMAIADLERFDIDLKRHKALAGSGAISGDELTHIENNFATAQSALNAAKANIILTKSQCDKANVDLNRTKIYAPIDGIIARRQAQLGQRIQPSIPLLSIVPEQEIYVNANFKEVELKKVRIGQKVKLTSDLYGDDILFQGTVEGFSGGTGSAFTLIPAQNATGNWIKVVQRLPVRIHLNATELAEHPLAVGLSMTATIDLHE